MYAVEYLHDGPVAQLQICYDAVHDSGQILVSRPQVRLLGIGSKLIFISHLMLYLMPTLKEYCPELHLKCLVKWLCPHACRYVSQIFARYPEHTVALLCLELILLILCL